MRRAFASIGAGVSGSFGEAAFNGKPWFDVTHSDYGATGDGVTDDAAAIQAAIDAAEAAGGGTVYLPAGDYLVATIITVPGTVTLMGAHAGASSSVVADEGGSRIFTTSALDAVVQLENTAGGVGGANLLRICVDGTDTATATVKTTGFGARIMDSRIKRGATYGLHLSGSGQGRCHVTNTHITQNARGTAVLMDSGCTDNWLTAGCRISGGTAAQVHTKSGGNNVIGCHLFSFPASGGAVTCIVRITAPSTSFQLADCEIGQSWGTAPIIMETTAADSASHIHIVDNYILNDSQTDASVPAIRIDTNSGSGKRVRSVFIRGNECIGSDTNRFTYLVEVTNASKWANVVVEHNAIRGLATALWSTKPHRNQGNVVVAGALDETATADTTSGATSVADGGTISHGLAATPTRVTATPSVAGELVSVTALGASTFTVAIKKHDGTAGTTQTVYWRAEV